MLPISEFGKFGLTAEFSAKVESKYAIWVQFLDISEDRYRRSQVFILAHQTQPALPGEERRIFLGQKVAVTELLAAFRERSEGVCVFRVVDHLIANRVPLDMNLYAGDNALVVVDAPIITQGTGERVLRAAHAVVDGTKIRPVGTPFFVKILLAEKISAFISRIQGEMGVADEDSRKQRFMLGDAQTSYTLQATLRGEGPMSDAFAALRGIADPYLFVLQQPEGKSTPARAVQRPAE
jgi:hypothetical protein